MMTNEIHLFFSTTYITDPKVSIKLLLTSIKCHSVNLIQKNQFPPIMFKTYNVKGTQLEYQSYLVLPSSQLLTKGHEQPFVDSSKVV